MNDCSNHRGNLVSFGIFSAAANKERERFQVSRSRASSSLPASLLSGVNVVDGSEERRINRRPRPPARLITGEERVAYSR